MSDVKTATNKKTSKKGKGIRLPILRGMFVGTGRIRQKVINTSQGDD